MSFKKLMFLLIFEWRWFEINKRKGVNVLDAGTFIIDI
jgi:hypothetical protein